MGNETKRAVVVEDSVPMRGLIRMALGSLGVGEIVEAGNGVEAIAALQSCGADIVIMDWKMDVMDGLECTRRIRAGIEGVSPGMPIVLLTGMAGEEHESEAYAAGVDFFLEKPFSLAQLHAGIVKVLDRAATGI